MVFLVLYSEMNFSHKILLKINSDLECSIESFRDYAILLYYVSIYKRIFIA